MLAQQVENIGVYMPVTVAEENNLILIGKA